MIEITYYPRFNTVYVRGHAHYAEEGKDIICAAVSAIVWTLAETVQKLVSENKAMEPKVRLGSGKAEVAVDARPDYEAEIKMIFGYICTGFEHIAQESADYVSYKKII